MKIKANVELELIMNDGETFEQANDRLYDLLFDGLCRNAPCEFWINSVEESGE